MSGRPLGGKSRVMRAASFLDTFWPQLLSIVGDIVFAVAVTVASANSPKAADWPLILAAVAGAVVLLFGHYKSWQRAPQIAALQERVQKLEDSLEIAKRDYDESIQQARLDYRERFEEELRTLARHTLEFGNTERISVYKHVGQAFVLLSRFSDDPDYTKPSKRGFYPDNEGCIGAAWHRGSMFIPELPDPEKELDSYYQVLKDPWNISRNTAKSFTMKSRSYGAYALNDLKGNRKIAIIVFESVRTNVLDDQKLRTALNTGGVARRIAGFMESERMLEPDPRLAREAGF